MVSMEILLWFWEIAFSIYLGGLLFNKQEPYVHKTLLPKL